MGEQAAKIGKKLEGFGVNFFANLGQTELTQDKEIKCTRSSHKKKTHGIDLLCKFTNPYIAGNQGIVVECKNRQMGSITRATIEEWVKELIQKAANTIFYSLIEEQKQVSVNNAALPG